MAYRYRRRRRRLYRYRRLNKREWTLCDRWKWTGNRCTARRPRLWRRSPPVDSRRPTVMTSLRRQPAPRRSPASCTARRALRAAVTSPWRHGISAQQASATTTVVTDYNSQIRKRHDTDDDIDDDDDDEIFIRWSVNCTQNIHALPTTREVLAISCRVISK